MRALVLFALAALVGCHGDTVQDFPGDSSISDGAVDSVVADTSRDGATDAAPHDSSAETSTDSITTDSITTDSITTDSTIDSADGDADVVCGTHPGPAMIAITVPGAGVTFCVDQSEVTRAQYEEFLGADKSAVTPKCGAHDYTAHPTSTPALNDPAIGVDWCDAYDYCQWAGKRLCGNINGGPILYGEWATLDKSEWYYACSNGTGTAYPYGDTYVDATCAGQSAPSVVAVMSLTNCHGESGPFARIFDMSGNVAEWDDSCDPPVGPTADASASSCHSRGGWVGKDMTSLRCDDNSSQFVTDYNDFTGFRCCSK